MTSIGKYIDAFDRMMELDKSLIFSKNISQDEIKMLFLSTLTSFSHSFGYEEDINFIIDNAYENVTNFNVFKKQILLSNLYRYSKIEKKKEAFRKIKYSLNEFFENNPNPLVRLKALNIFFISINNLYLKSDLRERKEICDGLSDIKNKKLGEIKDEIRNKNVLEESSRDIDDHIQSLEKGVLSRKATEEIVISLNNLKDDNEKEAVNKFLVGSSSLLKQIEEGNKDSYEKLNKRYYDLLHSFDFDSFNLETAKYFLYVLSAVRRVGGNIITSDLEDRKNEIENLLETSDNSIKRKFMFQLGFLNAGHRQETMEKLNSLLKLNNNDKSMFLYGSLCAKEGVLPPNDFEVDENYEIWDLDLRTMDYLAKINSYLPLPSNWDNFITLFKKLCKLQPSLIYHLISCLILIRALKKQPNLLKGTMNIEQIAKDLNSAFDDLASNKDFIDNFLWLIKSLYSSFPTNQAIITEYRTTAWNWYKEIAEITHKKDIENYEGIEKQMIYYFHDSPGPFHLEIMEAYCEFLTKDSDISYRELSRLLNKIKISLPRDYAKKLGMNLEKVQYNSQKLLNIFREIYSSSSVKVLFERLKNSEIKENMEKKIILLINRLSKYDLRSKRDITQKIVSRNELFLPEDYSLNDKIIILEELSSLSESISKEIKNLRDINLIKDLIAIQNSLESISYQFLFNLVNSQEKIHKSQILSLIRSGLIIVKPLMSNSLTQEIDYLVEETKNREIKDMKLYALLKKTEKNINNSLSWYLSSFQNKAKLMPYLDKDVRDNITADFLRETPIFPFSQLALKLLNQLSTDLNMEKDHITNIGKNEGKLIYIFSEKVKDYQFKGNEILITEDIDTHADLPLMKGIITKVQHPPLSHIALMARERKIPWYSPLSDEFENLKKEAIKNAIQNYSLSVFIGKCELSKINRSLIKEKSFSNKQMDIPSEVDKINWLMNDTDYKIETVGSKAFHLGILAKIFPNRIPKSVALTFGFFQDLIDNDKELSVQLEDLKSTNTTLDKKIIKDKLQKIRERIAKLKIDQEKLNKINRVIGELYGKGNIIVRSSTNAEDLAGHSAAGVYNSIICDKKKIHQTILNVFSSFYTFKAWEDRRFAKFNEDTCHMAVLVQKLIHSEYSFVIHTLSPLTYNSHEILIEIVPGLGEALVSGEPQFMGSAHQFVYNRKNKTIKRLAFITKSRKKTPTGEEFVNPNNDLFQETSPKLMQTLKDIFQDAKIIEEEIPKLKYGGSTLLPQDIEGVISLKNNSKQEFQVYYVQARNQFIPQIKIKKSKKIQTKVKVEKLSYKLKLPKPLSEGAYYLAHDLFGAKKDSNIIDLLKRSIKEVIGEGKVIIQPSGSMAYLCNGESVLWSNVKDIDLLLYSLDSKTKYDSYQFEKKYMDRLRSKFQELALKEGLTIHKTIIPKYLGSAIERAIDIRENSEKRTFGTNFSSDSFLDRLNLDKKKLNKNILQDEVELYLKTKQISKYNIYYSLKFDKNSDYPNLVLASFLKAYFDDSRLYAPVFWDWNRTVEVLYDLFIKANLISDQVSKKTFMEKFIKKHLEYNLIPQIEPFDYEEVEKNYPGMTKSILEGWTQAVITYIKNGGRITSKDIIIRDHIDDGAISSILSLFIHMTNSENKMILLDLIKKADMLKVPVPTESHIHERLDGNLKEAQHFLIAIKRILKPIKEGMNEKEAIRYMLNEPVCKMPVLDLLVKLILDLSRGDYTAIRKYSEESFNQLQKENLKITGIEEKERRKLFLFSELEDVVALDDSKGLKDLELKFLLLNKSNKVLVQFQEIKNNVGKIKGYRYYNVGINPKSDANILGLMEMLSIVEMIFHQQETSSLDRRNLWVGHSRPDIMITGPACSNFENCSVIPPKTLVELISLFLRYKQEKKLNYFSLNYERTLPKEYQKKINNFLYETKAIKIIEGAIKSIFEINPNLEIINEIDSFLIQQNKPHTRFLSCGKADLRIVPINYFTNPTQIKDPWWDKVPKGLYSWGSYYGDTTAIKRLSKILEDNPGEVSREIMIERELFQFFGNRRLTKAIKVLKTKDDTLKMLKETMRLSKFLSEDSILRKGFETMKLYNLDYNHSKQDILVLWQKLNDLSYKRVLNKISKNVDKLVLK
jgi:hypothetical protein